MSHNWSSLVMVGCVCGHIPCLTHGGVELISSWDQGMVIQLGGLSRIKMIDCDHSPLAVNGHVGH